MGSKQQRVRKSYTDEFKAEAVRLVREGGKSLPQIARDLGLATSVLRNWYDRTEVDAGRGAPGALTSTEREELARLRQENKVLRMEREILKRAATFFAKEST